MNTSERTKHSSALEFCRVINIPTLKYEADARVLELEIRSLPGVVSVSANASRQQISVCYDVDKTDYLTVIGKLEDSGFPILDNWFSRRKMDWYEFTENNARENAKAPPPACCNRPPK